MNNERNRIMVFVFFELIYAGFFVANKITCVYPAVPLFFVLFCGARNGLECAS